MQVLLVLNIPKVVRNKQLFNLFSLYGNIERIVLAREKSFAIITFERENDQMTAFHYLNNQTLYNSRLVLIPLKYPFILLQKCLLFPYLNFLEYFYLSQTKRKTFQMDLGSLMSEVPLIQKNLLEILQTPQLPILLQNRISSGSLVDLNAFLDPLVVFLNDFEQFSQALKEPSNLQQFLKLESELAGIPCLQHLDRSKKFIEHGHRISFELLTLKELPLESESVNYRNKKKKVRDGLSVRSKKINRPNKILYIFNLSHSLSLESIKDMFEGFEKVENHFYLNDSKNSALFHFKNVQAACHVLCTFKNVKFIDK